MELVYKYVQFFFFSSLRYLILTGIFFIVFYKLFHKKFQVIKIQEKKATPKDFWREISHSIQSNLVITFFAVIILVTPLRDYTLLYNNMYDYPLWWIPVSFVLSLIIHDTYFYWMHRLLHHKKIFRFTHFVHHKSTNPSPFASYSFHFFEAITEALVVFIIVFLLPIHPLALITFNLVGFLINIYGHLGYEIMPRWFRHSFLFQFINSSVYHNLHHLKFKGNYGLYFRVWDRLMKTESPDYIKVYDKIQEKKAVSNKAIKVAVVIPFLFTYFSTFAQIEGKWISSETKDVVEIYKEHNLFFGKAISSNNKVENEILKSNNVVILKSFIRKSETLYCCGSIFLPRRKMTVNGSISVIDKNKISVKGKYGLLSYNMIWNRL